MKNKKRVILIAVTVVAMLLISAAILFKPEPAADCLTAEEVAALRLQYPICADDPPMVSARGLSLEECVELADSFVYAEATGEIKRYSKMIPLGNEALEKKWKGQGIDSNVEFYEYVLIVIEDTEGKFKRGDEITIAANAMLEEYTPKLKKGMRVVVPVARDSDVKGRTWYTKHGMFYVTDDEYAISVFEEDTRSAKSGMKVDALLKELKK